jgi:hypothetical protein
MAGAVLMGAVDLRLFIPYAVAAGALVASFRVVRVRADVGSLPLFVAGCVALVYFVRPLVLAGVPGLFMYPTLGSLGERQIARALHWLTLLGPALVLGVALGLRLVRRRRAVQNCTVVRGRYLLTGRLVVDGLIVVTLVAMAVLTMRYSVDVRGVHAQTRYAFLIRLLPVALVYPVLGLMLLKYRRNLSRLSIAWYVVLLFALSALVFRQGSRIFVFELLVLLVVYALLHRGDFRMRLPRVAILSAAAVGALLGSFILGTAVREVIRGRASLGELTSLAVWKHPAAGVPEALWLEGLWATRRLQGFDGLVAVDRARPPEVVRLFRPLLFAERFIGELTPMSGRGPMGTGEAVSIYYSGLSPDARTAGSLGLMATLELMAGRWGAILGAFLVGVGVGVVWRLADWIRDPDARFIFLFLTAYHTLWLVMSGSLDMIGARYVTSVAQLVGLAVIMRVATAVMRPSLRSPAGVAASGGRRGTPSSPDVGLAT